jgi:hypothetical protein
MSVPPAPVVDEKQISRMRRWLRWAALLVAILIVLAAGLFFYRHHAADERLREMVEALDHSDPGWRLADIEAARVTVPDPENGARVVALAVNALPRNWPPADLNDALAVRAVALNERLAADMARKLEDELTKVESALRIARTLTDFPRGRYPITYLRNTLEVRLDEQLTLRRVAELLRHEAWRQMQAGYAREASRACLAGLHAARTLDDEPTAVSQLVRIACTAIALGSAERLLAHAEPDLADVEIIQRTIQEDDAQNPLRVGLRGERALMHELFDGIENGEVPVSDLFKSLSPSEIPWQARYIPWMVWDQVRGGRAEFLAILTPRVEATLMPLHEQEAADRAYAAACGAVPTGALVVRLGLPSDRYVDVCYRHHARLRCLAAALAADRYRRSHGRWPERLEELAPKYLLALPQDPYNGLPLRLKRLPDGLVIYSVGPDRIDNGGEMDAENPVRPGTDLGVRLWDVPFRAQPPRLAPPRLPGEPPR